MADQLVASSSLPPSWRYHVFLSFRGEDTRTNFTDHLYHALVCNEIKTFIDRHLPKGEEISPTLLKAIEESRISLVILSKNYADSRWCLEELVKIHQCRESEQQIIVPVFYKVDPSHVRNQTGCYGAAFIDHERKFEDKEMVIRWRNALKKVGNLSGYHVTEQKYEVDIIGDIVKDILNRLQVLDEIKQQKILALRSNNNKKYLRYIHQRIENLDGLVQFSEEDVKSEYAKFQIEPADSGNGRLVHIKCCSNNRYLTRANHWQFWIVAGAYEPLEDTSHWSCTLFEPMVVHSDKKAVFRLIHVQLRHFVTSFPVNDFHQCLYAGSNTTNLDDDMDVYTFVDLEQLVLPRSVALKSNHNKKYLRYIHQGIPNFDELVQLSGEDVKSEYAKFQMEPADSDYGGLVHIKCCFNNKYLRRANDSRCWIVAGADEPEEDKKRWSCTLFKPVVVHSDNKAVFRLLHVQLGHFVRSRTVNDFNQCLFAGRNTPDLHNMDVFTVIDLEPLVLPRSLALKSNNNKKYLRYIHQRIQNLDDLVQLSEENVKSEYAKFQIEPADGGLVHIKCCFNNKYLRRANDHQYWIVAGAYEPEEDKKHWSCTLFEPVVVHSDNKAVIRLIHVQLGHFVRSFTDKDFNQCLFAERSTPNLHNDMDVYTVVDLEPLVLPRSFALISNNNKKYLRYIDQRIENLDELVQLSEEDVKSKHAKFQMEPADSGYGGLVHIKCCVNNKYLRRANDHQYWIVAGANEPEEDKKHWSCTLFKPVVVHSDNKAVFRLLHVQLGHFVRYDFNQCLFAGPNTPNLHDNIDVYTVIDLEPLVLPSSLALKSNKNKKYLRYIRQRIKKLDEIVQLSEEDVKSEYAKFQIEPADGGLVHIKCCYNNKYLRRANDHQHWIVAGADEPEEDTKHWSCTLFEPVVVHSDNKAVFRLLHVQLGHFVTSLTFNDFNPCLCARSNTPNLHDDMDVYTVIDLEPLVLPSPFVLKSNNNNRYLRYMLDQENNILQILQFSAQDRTSEFAQFHVERANSRDHQNIHYVHIKCLNNNKYLRRMDKDNPLILAAADNRDENKERWTCTLFKPESVGPTGNNDNNVLCRLRHVATGLYTKPFVDNRFELRLGEENHDPQEVDVYTAIRTHT